MKLLDITGKLLAHAQNYRDKLRLHGGGCHGYTSPLFTAQCTDGLQEFGVFAFIATGILQTNKYGCNHHIKYASTTC